jgi:cellulose synthase/poly-beta-1,6-N-acetylglucosamine synthase-like glycosyltransferase
MASMEDIIFSIFVFLSVYVQVFFLITFLENRKKMFRRTAEVKLSSYPAVTIIVPCWNEETTVEKTVNSLLGLNYPKDKLKIFLVDDGSTDNTWEVICKFENHPNIKTLHKENGGKHTALNWGIAHLETDFVGCLDADSIVDREALVRIMSYFEKDENVMAVVPSIVVNNPKNIIERAQSFEHFMTVFMRKMHSFLGAVCVLPGPFSIYRKKVFDDLGPYCQAYNVEDTEMAYRMQKNHYKVADCHDAYVYTNMPKTIPKLYRQRLRWIYGVINNIIDYRGLAFKKKYGNFSMLVLPSIVIFMFSAVFSFCLGIYHLLNSLFLKILKFKLIGSFHFFGQFSHFDVFFIPTQYYLFFLILVYMLIVLTGSLGRRMVEGKWVMSLDPIYFFLVFGIVAPFWLMKAIYSTLVSKKPAWR